MDLITYQTERDTELIRFKKDYADLKVQYMNHLTDAVYEKDPAAQSTLVKQVLDANSELSTHVRDFLGQSNSKFDSKTISELTQDIINYQKEYSAIKNSENKVTAIHSLLNSRQTELNEIEFQFNIMLGLLGFGILVLLFLIFRTSIAQWSVPQVLPVQYTSTS